MEDSSMNTEEDMRSTHNDDEDVPEESGWTVYIDDFYSNRELPVASSPSSSSGSASLVSDAASIAARNKLYSNPAGQSLDKGVLSKKLRLLKKGIVRRGGAMDIDDALEDTASSPVNSPVTSDHHMIHRQFDHLMNTQRKIDDHTSCSTIFLRNKQMGGGHFSSMKTDGRNHDDELHRVLGGGQGWNGRESECTELKKKGLCVVPMSMAVNYFG